MSDKEKRAMYMSLEELRDYAYDVVSTKVRKTSDSDYSNGVFSSTGDWKKLYEYLQELIYIFRSIFIPRFSSCVRNFAGFPLSITRSQRKSVR